ncbi:D-alanyl-D-alanine carboxypeptidase family protein [Candidatus Saccharibacteria bacterium oral taxon 488]|nr:D-alanyl-D-alanine carboxypeptidase family protein [Candidatus Saccharibacteria bacterium oral taxon 488]
MKITKRLRERKLLLGLGAVLIIASSAVATYFTLRHFNPPRTTAQQPISQEQPAPTPKEKDPDSPKTPAPAAPITIALPNATPIPARIVNSADDADLWKIANKSRAFANPRYQPSDLRLVSVPTLPGRGQDERSLRAVLMPDLEKLVAAARAAGVTLRVGSGYRSYATQASLFASYARRHGEAEASRFSSRPGHSEHQSGLAVDFAGADQTCWVDDCFERTTAGKWLAAHAHEYGFILRYPKGKESITGYQYEPWHFRYVGRELAGALHQSGLTMEEAWSYIEEAMTKLKQRGTQ